ncbi:ferrous iron transport protein B [Clostridium saccharobutylicum]|uniref:Ferrous iron transport protein B n=1 Tax=Clostridium saccharobutylicum DSM 13864 TaxID=1345695 RepID=U5MYX5_CLOSA|nr:ferrous iron transport protein B [Clostridium saccharobutylicum]AGX44861.1 ferrous iron transport protein B [Clostridium saccharobutylicum DSM 13864]AQR92143.1 ferrous iron transport protein B [Clostridium saccharobutylicum]AQS02045.1 ferrous iron transport protein B [Clostridium saccharobutylicum]AQS11649.1 ferrous iron transport protein B [Clostridium saccharobutylicum]AQS16028.1 ferrous iron transport protein B [Clostridium saccharobutylicum]
MAIKIGLAGNPNCGKTTMFNELTGSTQYVGNWPGVTVEKKGGKLKGHKDVEIVDLPGVYSLSPYTLEEVVTRDFMINDKPDAVINIVDGSNIERNLYLTTQILELGIPTVIALNMMDIVEKNGDKIDLNRLSQILGCPVVETSALKGNGVKAVAEKAIEVANKKQKPRFALPFSDEAKEAFKEIKNIILEKVSYEDYETNWLSIKLFERDSNIIDKLKISKSALDEIEGIIKKCENEFDDDSESIVTGDRYSFIGSVVSEAVKKKNKLKENTSDKIDKVVTNRFLALPIFVAIMFTVYYVAITIGTQATDWINDTLFTDIIQGNVSNWLVSLNVADWLQGLIIDGIISGVGSVLGFVPQIALLFLFLSILEDCGYMARVAFIMDRIFRKFGLSGKSFIPMLISSGCGVPGIMATRTMENDRDRKMTIMLTTFIPCSAKLPVIALIGGAFFSGSPWVAPSAYFLGIIMIIICGIILKKTKLFAGDTSPFVMELPQYHIPKLNSVVMHMWERVRAFIKKAGTIILVSCTAVWFLQSFNWSFEMVDAGDSILASIGNLIAPIFEPIGFGNWQSAVATVTGLVAKENLVGTFGVLYGVSDASESDPALVNNVAAMFTAASGFAFMAFNLLCAPCFAAIGAIRREMGTWKWTFITLGFQTLTAYIVALVINQVGNFILGVGSLTGAITSVIIAIAVVLIVVSTGRSSKENKIDGQLSYTK